MFHFIGVKKLEFDQAILVLYTPRCIYLVEWDGKTGYTSNGMATESLGGQIVIYGQKYVLDWAQSLDGILAGKLPGRLIGELSFHDSQYSDILTYTTRTARLFADVPLSTLSVSTRGRVIEKIARRYDSRFGPTMDPLRETVITRGGWAWRAPSRYDYAREDGSKVEVKPLYILHEAGGPTTQVPIQFQSS